MDVLKIPKIEAISTLYKIKNKYKLKTNNNNNEKICYII